MNTNDELMERLAKILRLANDKGATPGEVEAAMAMAKRLADKHNVDLAMVNFASDPTGSKLTFEVRKEDLTLRSQRRQLYHLSIFRVLQAVFGVRVVFFGSSNRFCLVGAATDVLICKELLPWLEDVFCSTMTRYKNQARQQGRIPQGNGPAPASFLRGIYHGMEMGIIEANRREEAKQDAATRGAMAVVLRRKEDAVDASFAELFPKAKQHKDRSQGTDAQAFGQGYNEGRKVRLDQVAAPRSNLRLN